MIKDVIIIAGPTAVGKSSLAIKLAKALDTEIISCDSMQIYKQLDIGTDKIKESQMLGIAHHLIDIIDPSQSYSVNEFQKDALNIIDQIHKKGKIPIVAGGTGLYINSIYYKYEFNDVKPDLDFRREMEEDFIDKARYHLDKLMQIDSDKYSNLTVRDKKKIIRALEVYKYTGKSIEVDSPRNEDYNFHLYILNDNRESIYARINDRVDKMLDEGLLEEVKTLINQGIDKNSQSMKAIGYKEVIDFIDKKFDYQTMVEKLKQNSRRYAKRQLTWFRKIDGATWLNKEDLKDEEIILKILGDLNVR